MNSALVAKVSLILVALGCLAAPSAAHTFSEIELKCPVDGTRVKARETMSMTQFGSFLDFQKQGAIGSYYEDLVHGCPKCHFSGSTEDFKKRPADAVVAKIRAELEPAQIKTWPDHAAECVFTARIYEWEGRKSMDVADQYLVASFLLRGAPASEQERRREMQRLAATHFEKALAANEITGTSRAAISYLVGEMYRRTGAFDAALSWYAKATAEPARPEWLAEIIEDQRKLAEQKNDDNTI